MPKQGQLTTEWIRVATEGQTIDGRTITGEWIDQMAETYSTDEYVGLIWPEHRRFNWFEGKDQDNWGEVIALKAEDEAGKRRLFARLRPNSHLLLANEKGQKLFTSIEPDPDFCNSGKCYLVGLAVTDRPASTGTTRLQFSANKSQEVTALEPLEMDFQLTEKVKHSLLSRMFSLIFNEPEPDAGSPQPEKDDEPMNTEQFKALTDSLTQLATGQAQLQQTLQQHFSASKDTPPADVPPADVPPVVTAPQGGEQHTITAEQFNQVTASLTQLAQGQTALQQQFSKLLEEDGRNIPDLSGGDGFDCNTLV